MYRSKRVLVVEDDAIQADCLATFLRKEGITRVRSCLNGEAALSILAVETFDIMIIDVYMPGIDGIELTRILRRQEKTKDMPVFIVTAASALRVIELAGGMDKLYPCKIIEKPFDLHSLVEDIKNKLMETPNDQTCKDTFTVNLSGSSHHGTLDGGTKAVEEQ